MHVVTAQVLGRRLGAVGGVPRIVAGGNHAVPWQLVSLADGALESFRLFMLNAPAGIPHRPEVALETPFVGPGMRHGPNLRYYPSRLSLVPRLLQRETPPDIVLLNVAPPRQGMVSLGVEVNILPAAIEAARARGGLVVAQLNRHMPFTVGDALISLDQIDLAIEADEPLVDVVPGPLSEVQKAIGAHVATLVEDGATLQLGIGAIPDAVLRSLTGRCNLHVWSEMVSDGVACLARAGALAAAPIVTSFAAGSQEFYHWLDRNEQVVFRRTECTNDPATIARQPAMTSINAALQVDLYAQANASYVRGRVYSGFGGQPDFVVGALHAAGGRAIVALPSWHEASDSSTIVDHLPGPATSFQHSYVVTEQGIAAIWGRPLDEQARQLIDRAAHPRARTSLLQTLSERMGEARPVSAQPLPMAGLVSSGLTGGDHS